MTLGDVIAALGEYLYEFVPVRTVNAWQQGVYVRAGRVRKLCTHGNGVRGTGIHFFVPALDQIFVGEANTDVVLTPTQTCTTKDGMVVTFSFVARFRVVDLAKMYATIFAERDAIIEEVSAGAGEWIVELTAKEAKMQLADKVWRDVQERIGEWGVEIEALTLQSFAKCNTVRLIGSSPVSA